MELKEEARKLIANLNQRMNASPYDMAWAARLRREDGPEPLWPDLPEWLLGSQHDDGSWGSDMPYYHDRIICTLAAGVALRQNGRGDAAPEVNCAIKRAERFLWNHLHLLPRDHFELVGFELLFPSLLAEAQALGMDVPKHTCGYGAIQAEKLRLIPPDLLYSPNISTIHSLEFLGRSGDLDKLENAFTHGSLGNSPAGTSYYLQLRRQHGRPYNPEALAYLEGIKAHLGYINILYPFRIFELTWALNNLAFSELPVTEFAGPEVWRQLQEGLSERGIGLDPTFGIPDGDITSVTSRLLIRAGYPVDPLILARYENKETRIFRTYHYERNISVGTNVHCLEALDMMPDYPDCQLVKEQIVLKLLDNRLYDIYWIDKWHTSPYYATSHVLIGLLREGFYLVHSCRDSIDWLLHTQRRDGSWGFFETGTAEETAYVLTALLHYHQRDPIDTEILQRGAAYLLQTYQAANPTYPALWIDKCLYVPHDVVHASVLAALLLYEESFGRLP
jgi:halimadienyl-diphosphate synthase